MIRSKKVFVRVAIMDYRIYQKVFCQHEVLQ